MTTHLISNKGRAVCGATGELDHAVGEPTCPGCLDWYIDKIKRGIRASGREAKAKMDAQERADNLLKAAHDQARVNAGAVNAEMRKVEVIHFEGGRQAALIKKHEKKLEAWPINASKFKPGEEVRTKGTLANGKACVIVLKVGGRCLHKPEHIWMYQEHIEFQVPLKVENEQDGKKAGSGA